MLALIQPVITKQLILIGLQGSLRNDFDRTMTNTQLAKCIKTVRKHNRNAYT